MYFNFTCNSIKWLLCLYNSHTHITCTRTLICILQVYTHCFLKLVMMCCHPDHSHLQKQERLTDQFLYLTFGVKPTGTAAVNGLARRFHFFWQAKLNRKLRQAGREEFLVSALVWTWDSVPGAWPTRKGLVTGARFAHLSLGSSTQRGTY